MSNKAEVVLSLKDNYSSTLKKIVESNRKFETDLDGMQKKLSDLNRTRADLKLDLSKAKDELDDARKKFKEFGDAASEAAYIAAQAKYDEACDNVKGVTKEINNAKKAMEEYLGLSSKISNSGTNTESSGSPTDTGKSSTNIGKALFGSQLANQLSSSLSNALGQYITSAYGSATGETFGNILSGISSGAISGAALGSVIPGLGTGIGTAIGAGVGLVTGIINDTSSKQKTSDSYFQSTVQDIYNDVIENRSTMVSEGAALAGTRETTQMAFSNLLREEAAASGRTESEYAADFLEKVNEFSRKTPFMYDELTSLSKTMLTYGYGSGDIFDLLTKVGDAGAALSLDSSGKNAVATIIGRMNLTDKVTAEYVNSLQARGIKVIDYIRESLEPSLGALTNADINSMISSGELSGQAVAKVILEYMGTEYSGAMEAMQYSYEGLLSTLEGWDDEMQAAFGSGYTERRKEQMQTQIGWYEQNADDLKRMYSLVGEYEADLVGAKEKAMRESMDDLLERTEGITDPSEMSRELYDAIVKAQTEYYDSEAYGELYSSQIALVNSIQNDIGLIRANFDAGEALGKEFTKGWASAASAVSSGLKSTNDSIDFDENEYTLDEAAQGVLRYFQNSNPGYAFGIARIPYNDYTARLHEGERVLTAAEARRMDAGSGASVVITGNTFVVRDESDIDLIAETICERLKEAEAIYAR